MSKTFRKRKGLSKGLEAFYWFHDYVRNPITHAWTDVAYPEKELKKRTAIFHSDSLYKCGPYRQDTDIKHRMDVKRELIRFTKDPEHEVQIRRKRYRTRY